MTSTNASSSNPSKKIKLTIIPPRQLFVNISSDEEVTTTPSPITTSSSPSAPNAPSKTTSTKETTSSHENTSSSFQSKLQLSPTPSNEPTSPQTQNPFLQNLMDVPPRPSNPQPIQTISPLDITLSLSPITPLEIPSSPPSPQPPIMGHPLYYNYHDYHGSTCVCCFHNRNLYLNLRDEMNIMNLLRELHTPLSSATLIYYDNISAIYLSRNPVQHQRTKHIEIDIHFVRNLVAAGQVRVLLVPSRYQYANIFTKGLPSALFEEFRISLSVRCSPALTAGEC
ncbi:pentatricopeptide repeat-containing protein [Tanacetum coccineum]